jgi:hypothetical protein
MNPPREWISGKKRRLGRVFYRALGRPWKAWRDTARVESGRRVFLFMPRMIKNNPAPVKFFLAAVD